MCLFAIVLGLSSSFYVYAKYYSVSAREGVAIATGVYFNSNYAHNAEGVFVETLVDIGYKGGRASLSLEVYNYENNLLFNTENVNIPYEIEMWLDSAPTDGAEYSLSIGTALNDTKQVLGVGEENKRVISSQTISGGAARINPYYILVDAPENHTPIPIYVRVKTLSGSLINRELTGKILLAGTAQNESKIEAQGLVIPDEPADLSDEFERLIRLSSFTYEVLTVGAVADAGVTEELKVMWNPTVFTIDLFDTAYTEWMEKTGNTEPLVDAVSGMRYITIDAMPYAAEKIGFFRGPDFDERATDLDTLETYIEAYKLTTTS